MLLSTGCKAPCVRVASARKGGRWRASPASRSLSLQAPAGGDPPSRRWGGPHLVHAVLVPPLQDACQLPSRRLRPGLLLVVATHTGQLQHKVRLAVRLRRHQAGQGGVDASLVGGERARLLQVAVHEAGA